MGKYAGRVWTIKILLQIITNPIKDDASKAILLCTVPNISHLHPDSHQYWPPIQVCSNSSALGFLVCQSNEALYLKILISFARSDCIECLITG